MTKFHCKVLDLGRISRRRKFDLVESLVVIHNISSHLGFNTFQITKEGLMGCAGLPTIVVPSVVTIGVTRITSGKKQTFEI